MSLGKIMRFEVDGGARDKDSKLVLEGSMVRAIFYPCIEHWYEKTITTLPSLLRDADSPLIGH